ncbi:MAG: tannase/feruloyl esterase family alpha/beta hydrolase [Aquabacterium sp.]
MFKPAPPALAALAALPLLLACSPLSHTANANLSVPATVRDAPARCTALAQHRADRLRITSTEWVAAGLMRARDPDNNREVGEPLPAHCLLRGRLDERIGVDREPYHTGFELRLPAAGNGRLLYQGGSGNDGALQMAVGRNSGAAGWADNGLQRGFAAVSTDAGHQSPAPNFGLDPVARDEHAWRAHWRTATTARSLFERWYGQAPQRSYFIGCGGGGRQGMMFTQRFPELFDGVIAQAPAMRASAGATIAAAWTVQQFLQATTPGPNGRRILSTAFTDTQLQRVAREILDRCDAADGLADGLVGETALCRINPRRLVCPDGGDGCLSAAQAQALATAMAGPVNRDGGRLYFAWPWDPGIAHPGWRAWTLGSASEDEPDARHLTLTSGALSFVVLTPPDPTLTVQNFAFERDPLRMQSFHRHFGTADEVLLRPFQQRGGKLMLVHGMADPVFSALETVDYQQRVTQAHGAAAASRFVRTFLVPGMNHCAGGPATDRFDALSAIVAWVEQGQPPERLVAHGTSVLPGLSRPLCPYPKIARYTGGDTSLADSFECR